MVFLAIKTGKHRNGRGHAGSVGRAGLAVAAIGFLMVFALPAGLTPVTADTVQQLQVNDSGMSPSTPASPQDIDKAITQTVPVPETPQPQPSFVARYMDALVGAGVSAIVVCSALLWYLRRRAR